MLYRMSILQAWKPFGQFELGTNCRAWLFKILFHTLHHYRRKWLNFRMIKESDEILEHTRAGSPPLPEHVTDQEILARLAEIPHDFRAVVLLIDVEEFSYKEAAGSTQCSHRDRDVAFEQGLGGCYERSWRIWRRHTVLAKCSRREEAHESGSLWRGSLREDS